MKIAFRADASVYIGIGHVMRCLTLANTLRDHGAQCLFLSADLPGHIHDTIRAHGHDVAVLPRDVPVCPSAEIYESWLATPVAVDAAQVLGILQQFQPDRVVMDHYALDKHWVAAAVPNATPVMVIDDLANRDHSCDILLDQNLGRSPADYHGRVPNTATVLAGPKYALLRPEFAQAREESLARRQVAKLNHIMISLGGVDKDNVTSTVLELLQDTLKTRNVRVTVVMGPSAPHLKQVCRLAATMTFETTVLCNVQNMADLMKGTDLAIGAAGSTSWERCCLGLPTLLLVLADNQRPAAQAMRSVGAVSYGFTLESDAEKTEFKDILITATNPMILAQQSQNAARLTNGKGAYICSQMMIRGSSIES